MTLLLCRIIVVIVMIVNYMILLGFIHFYSLLYLIDFILTTVFIYYSFKYTDFS